MRSLLQQLENNEAILQMYLCGELDAQDQQEVEQLLSQDKGLADQLREMEADQAVVSAALASLDGPASASDEARRLRQVSRLIKSWQIEQLTRPAPVKAGRSLRVPRWAIPVAAAAAVLCFAIGWWGLYPDSSGPAANNTVAVREDGSVTPDGQPGPAPTPTSVAIDLTPTPWPISRSGIGTVWPLTQPDEATVSQESTADADVQQQASSLWHRSEDGSSTASIFMTDTTD